MKHGVLVDTFVWVEHFRHRNPTLERLLHQDAVLTHLMIIGEIACGTPPAPRAQTLGDLGMDRRLADLAERFGVTHRAPP